MEVRSQAFECEPTVPRADLDNSGCFDNHRTAATGLICIDDKHNLLLVQWLAVELCWAAAALTLQYKIL